MTKEVSLHMKHGSLEDTACSNKDLGVGLFGREGCLELQPPDNQQLQRSK